MYAAVEAIARDGALATATVCDVLAVSRSAYYAWFHGEPTRRDREIESLTGRCGRSSGGIADARACYALGIAFLR